MEKITRIYLRLLRRLAKRKDGFFYNLWRKELGRLFPEDKQFEAFDNILWDDGFHFTGDVTDPNNQKSDFGQGITYHEIFIKGVLPFIDKDSIVLEIGPGRGSWTKGLLTAKEVWGLDAKSLENNKIMEFLGHPKNLKYFQVKDFECRDLPNDYFDFVFSYGCFCHIPWEGIEKYIKSIYKKMKFGSSAIIMISDDVKRPDNINLGSWYPGCFIPNNAAKMEKLLKSENFTVINSNFLDCKRDSIIYFKKMLV